MLGFFFFFGSPLTEYLVPFSPRRHTTGSKEEYELLSKALPYPCFNFLGKY